MAQTATAENMDPEQPDGPDVRGLPDFIDSYNDLRKQTAEKSANQGAQMKKFCEEKNLHAGAAKLMADLGDMSEDKRNDYLNTLVPALKTMIPVWNGPGSQIDMFNGDEPGGADTDALKNNVTQMKPDAAPGGVDINPPA